MLPYKPTIVRDFSAPTNTHAPPNAGKLSVQALAEVHHSPPVNGIITLAQLPFSPARTSSTVRSPVPSIGDGPIRAHLLLDSFLSFGAIFTCDGTNVAVAVPVTLT